MEKEIKRGEIYYADLSPTIGREQDGFRPVLILQNDMGNKYGDTTIVAAITSRQTSNYLPTHVKLVSDCMKCESIIMLEQIRTIDKTRLGEYVGRISKQTRKLVNKAIAISLGIKYVGGGSK